MSDDPNVFETGSWERDLGAARGSKGAVAGFPACPSGAHRLRNVSNTRARYLLVSTMRMPEVAEQVDTGTILAMTAPGDGWAFPAGVDADYIALTLAAIEADK
jgi:uncharacterized cupin superfamily protein